MLDTIKLICIIIFFGRDCTIPEEMQACYFPDQAHCRLAIKPLLDYLQTSPVQEGAQIRVLTGFAFPPSGRETPLYAYRSLSLPLNTAVATKL